MKRGGFICRKVSLIAILTLCGLVVLEISCKKPVEVFSEIQLKDFDTVVYEGFSGYLTKMEVAHLDGAVYSLENIGPNELYIDRWSGDLFSDSRFSLDYERDTVAVAKVTATLGDEIYTAMVRVKLLDKPDFLTLKQDTFYVNENPKVGQVIGKVEILTDRKFLKQEGAINYLYQSVLFDTLTGIMTVNDPETFNYESHKYMFIEVVVNDGNNTYKLKVYIIVKDVVDGLSLTEKLNQGAKPFDLMKDEGVAKEEFYGLWYKGGYIYYLDENNRRVFNSRYEVSKGNFSTCGFMENVLDTAIGVGRENTGKMSCGNSPAAWAYSFRHTKGDYHLPSKGEMRAIWTNIKSRYLNINEIPNFWIANKSVDGKVECFDYDKGEFKQCDKGIDCNYLIVNTFTD